MARDLKRVPANADSMGPLLLNQRYIRCPKCGCNWGYKTHDTPDRPLLVKHRHYDEHIQCGMCSRELA